MKRKDYISWDDYFMAVARLSAMRSKDPNTQVGACIVNKNRRLIGIGYNGFPDGCSDENFPWKREGEPLDTKYLYVCHAEENAIANVSNSRDIVGSTMYTSLFPCNECAKLIIQTGVLKVCYMNDKYHDTNSSIAARKMFCAAGVRYELVMPSYDVLTIRMRET